MTALCRSSGGPRELEKVAHMSDSSIQRLNDGILAAGSWVPGV